MLWVTDHYLCSDIITNGFIAYDVGLKMEVVVTTAVICFLGDSPMHAEVTNTPNPGVSLNPCRICPLKVSTLAEKVSQSYVLQSVGLNEFGERVRLYFF